MDWFLIDNGLRQEKVKFAYYQDQNMATIPNIYLVDLCEKSFTNVKCFFWGMNEFKKLPAKIKNFRFRGIFLRKEESLFFGITIMPQTYSTS